MRRFTVTCCSVCHPGIWGKEFPVSAADSGTLDPVDPHRPTVYRKNGTLVFAIPSHDGFKSAIDSMVLAHRDEMSRADRLIIDLRGNEGGGSLMTNNLEPFIRLKEERPNPYPTDRPLMLSSDDQIAYARRAFGAETTAFVRGLVARMRAHPGELVPVNDPAAPPAQPDPRDWVVSTGPRAVGVLIDRGTVSASEVLVLVRVAQPTRDRLRRAHRGRARLPEREHRHDLAERAALVAGIRHDQRVQRVFPRAGCVAREFHRRSGSILRMLQDPVAYVDKALAGRR